MILHDMLARRPAVLSHALTRVVVQAAGQVRASTNGGQLSKASGPVRYVPRKLPSKDHRTTSRETGADGLRQSDEDSNGETTTRRLSEKAMPVRWTDRKSSKDKSSSPAWLRLSDAEHSNLTSGELDNEFWDADLPSPKTAAEELGGSRSRRGSSNEDPRTSARNYTMALLARGPQTEFQLRRKLTRRNVPPEMVDETIKDLQRCGLQSDEEYTEIFARSRWHDNAWGPMRIKFELCKRGVSKEMADAGLASLFQKSQEVGGKQDKGEDLGKWGMTTEAADHLMCRAQQRWAQGRDLEISVRRRRLAGWLQRRGFNWTLTADVLKSLESLSQSDSED